MQSMIAINWPLLISTDSPELPGKLTIPGMAKMRGNEDKVTNKRFDENSGNLYAWGRPYSNIFFLSEYYLFYLEVNLMPYGFLFSYKVMRPVDMLWRRYIHLPKGLFRQPLLNGFQFFLAKFF